MYHNTRITHGVTAVTGSATVTLYDSASDKQPLQHSDIMWVVYHIDVDANADNTLDIDYSNDNGENWIELESITVGTDALEGEVFVGHFEHIRIQFTAGSSDVDSFDLNLNLHAGERSAIGL